MRSAAMVVLLLAALSSAAAAQPTAGRLLTLEQAVERARTASFDVRIAQADAVIASADAAGSHATLRPQISVSANALDANEPQLGMPVARQAYGAASLTVPLFTPSGLPAARAADAGALAARTAVSATANDAVFNVTQGYRRIQLADAVLEARRTAVADQEGHLRVTEQRVAAGKMARYLTARDRAAVAIAQQAQEDAASERDQAANDLAAMLDLTLAPLSVEPLGRDTLADVREVVLTRALRQRPSLVAAEQRVTAASAGVAAARGAYRPSVALTAQTYNGGSSPSLGRSGGQVSVTASIPVVDGGWRSAAFIKARAQYDRAAAARDQMRAGVARDVANSWREYEAATRNNATAAAALTDAQEQLRVASLRESAGKAIPTEVLDALSLVASARETLARSIARYDIAIAAIHHAAGDFTP